MVKARRPSWGLGHLPVWLHSPKEPTAPFLFFQSNSCQALPVAEAVFPDSMGLSIRVRVEPGPSLAGLE